MALLGQPIPAYVNRCAYIASFFSCLFPKTEGSNEDLPVRRFGGKKYTLTHTNQNGVDSPEIDVI